MVRSLLAMQETWVRSLGWEGPLEEEMAIHSSILAWRIPGQRSLVGYSPWGHIQSGMTEWLTHTHMLTDAFEGENYNHGSNMIIFPILIYHVYSINAFLSQFSHILPQFFLTIMKYRMTWNTMIYICRWQKNLDNLKRTQSWSLMFLLLSHTLKHKINILGLKGS